MMRTFQDTKTLATMSDSTAKPASLSLPVVTPADPVPVYDCRVIFSGPDETGLLHGRVTNLEGVVATAKSERELLTRLVKAFKEVVVQSRNAGREVPWISSPDRPQAGEQQRWIPVHL